MLYHIITKQKFPSLIFVPTFDTGWVFFSSDKFRLFNWPFLTEFFFIIQKVLLFWAQIWKDIHLWSFFVKLWGFKDCHFGHFDQFGTINARYISGYYRVSGDLIRLRNRSKLFEGSLFAVNDLLQGTKSTLMFFIWRVGGWFS